MIQSHLRRWLQSLYRPASRTILRKGRNRASYRTSFDELESRLAPATTLTWTGTGATDRWSNPANWDSGVPQTGDTLVFPAGAPRNINTNDLPASVQYISSILFDGPGYTGVGYTLKGLASATALPITTQISSNFAGSSSNTITFNIPLIQGSTPSTLSIITSATGDLTITGKLTGPSTSSLLFPAGSNAGITYLNGDNSGFDGLIGIQSGLVSINNANALGSTVKGTTVLSTAQLQITAASPFTVAEPLTISGSGVNATGALLLNSGNATWSGPVTIQDLTGGTTLVVGVGVDTGNLTISGQILDVGGAKNLTKTGPGRLILAPNLTTWPAGNIYQGVTTVQDGVLDIQNAKALGATTQGTVVNNGVTQKGTLQLEDPSGVGFTVLDEQLTITGSGYGGANGAVHNLKGNNVWKSDTKTVIFNGGGSAGFLSVGVATGTSLMFDVVVTGSSYTKVLPGKLIFTRANTYAGTSVSAGVVNTRDSQGLGTGGVTVSSGAALEFEADARDDSVLGTGVTDLQVSNVITLNGTGVGNTGALRNIQGTNVSTSTVSSINASIGVEPDPDPTGANAFAYDDFSRLTVNILTGNSTVTKVGKGELILPNANTGFTGQTFINAGWVTIQDAQSLGKDRVAGLGDTVQAGTTVASGAALVLLPGADTDFFENLTLSGLGIPAADAGTLTRRPEILQLGAIVNLSQYNTLSGDIKFTGVAGIGVEVQSPPPPVAPPPPPPPESQLVLTGSLSETAPGGGFTKLGTRQLIIYGDGTFSGPVDIKGGVVRIANDTALGQSLTGTQSTTTVEAGTALLLAPTVALNNGGIAAGLQTWFEKLVLSGTGSTIYDPSGNPTAVAPLALVNDGFVSATDNMWRGPVTLISDGIQSDVVLDIPANFRLTIAGIIDDGVAPATPMGIHMTDQGKLVLSGANTYRGLTTIDQGVVNVQNSKALGTAAQGTVVKSGASLEIQGNLVIADTLDVWDQGIVSTPSNPTNQWFDLGPSPITNGQTPGTTKENVTGRITGVVTDPTDPNVIYATAGTGGIWKTKNGGVTWFPLTDINPAQNLFMSTIAIDPAFPNILYVGTGEANNGTDTYYGRGVLKSIDSGRTWTLYPGNEVINPGINTVTNEFDRQTISKIIIDPVTNTGVITGATKATPIVITSVNHGLSTGDVVTVSGVLGNTAANGTWTITRLSANTFRLNGSSGNANYASGGHWTTATSTQTIFVSVSSNGVNGLSGNSGVYEAATGSNDPTQVVWQNLVLNPFPVITSISPGSGSTGGGYTAILNGVNFSTVTAVKFGNTTLAATDYTIVSDTEIDVINTGTGVGVPPASAGGKVDVMVTNSRGNSDTTGTGDDFTYVAAPNIPTISTLTNTSTGTGPTGAGTLQFSDNGNQTIDIVGTNFTGATKVMFVAQNGTGTVTSSSFTVNSATSITATTPVAWPGTFNVRVLTASGITAANTASRITYTGSNAVPPVPPAPPTFTYKRDASDYPPSPSPPATSTATFSGSDTISDLLVVQDPDTINRPGNRFLIAAVGNAVGRMSNRVYVSFDNGATWGVYGLLPTYSGDADINFPHFGTIKLAISAPQLQPTHPFPGQTPSYQLYAFVDYPTSYGSIPSVQALQGQFRDVFTNTIFWNNPNSTPPFMPSNSILYDINRNSWSRSTPASLGTAPTSSYVGSQGPYDSVLYLDQSTNGPNYTLVVAGAGYPLATAGYWRSTDGGGSWADISMSSTGANGPHGNAHVIWKDSLNRLLVGTDGGLWRLDSTAPVTWTNLNGNMAITQFNGIDVDATLPNIAVGRSQGNGTEIYTNNPVWAATDTGTVAYTSYPWAITDSGLGGVIRIDPLTPVNYKSDGSGTGTMYHRQSGLLRKSTNGGATWSTLTFPANPTAVTGFYLDNLDTRRLLAATLVGTYPVQTAIIYESLTRGTTWTSLNNYGSNSPALVIAGAGYQGTFVPDSNVLTGFPSVTDKGGANVYDPDTIYVMTASGVFVTKDHGATWRNRTPAGGSLSDLIVDPSNRDTAYVVRSAFGGTKLYKTTNAGQSWTNISGNLPDLPVWTVVLDPRSGDLYVGNDMGVYKAPAGNTGAWARFGAGLPDVQVRDLVLNTGLNTLTAGTYGRGAYQIALDSFQANAGVVRAISGTSTITGAVTLHSGTTIGVEGSQTINGTAAQLTLLGNIFESANFNLTKIGQGTLVLSGDNSSFTGEIDVNAGVLAVGSPTALGDTGGQTYVNAGALELRSNVTTAEPLHLFGDGFSFNGHNTGALRVLTGTYEYDGPVTLESNNVTIGVGSASFLTMNGSIGEANRGVLHSNLTKELTGTLILPTANTYVGFTIINQGIVDIQDANALGTNTNGTIVLDTAQLQIGDPLDPSPAPIVVTGEDLYLSGIGFQNLNTGALENIAGNNTWKGNVHLNQLAGFQPATSPSSIISFGVDNATETLTIDGTIDDITYASVSTPPPPPLSNLGINKVGLGTLIFKDFNSYQGVSQVTAGVLSVQASGGLGSGGSGVSTTVNAGATLELNGGVDIPAQDLFLNGQGVLGTLDDATTGNVGALHGLNGANVWDGHIILQISSTINVDAGSTLDVKDAVNDPSPLLGTAGDLTKIGGGTLTFWVADNYTGNTLIKNGTLIIKDGQGLGLGTGTTTVSAGGTLGVDGSGSGTGGITVNNENLTISGTGYSSGGVSQGALLNIAGNNSWLLNITMGSNVALGATAGTMALYGVLNGGTFGVTKLGAGTVAYKASTANNYSGSTQVNQGTLILDDSGTTVGGGRAFGGSLVIGTGTGVPAVVQLLGNDEQIPDAKAVQIKSDGSLNLNGRLETINSLAIDGGSAATGAGTLVVQALNMTGGTVNVGGSGLLKLTGNIIATSKSGTAALIDSTGGTVSLNGADRTFTVNAASPPSPPVANDMVIKAAVTGTTQALTKDGTGNLQLMGASTYTGGTTVKSGGLQVDGSVGDVILTGGNLSGTGVVGNVSNTSSSNIDPGDNPGTGNLTAFNVTLNNVASMSVQVTDTGNFDKLTANGSINLGSATLVGAANAPIPNVAVGNSVTIIQGAPGTSTFANPLGIVFVGGLKFHIDYYSDHVTLTRVDLSPVISLVANLTKVTTGNTDTFTATLQPDPGSNIVPTGTVDFSVVDNDPSTTVSITPSGTQNEGLTAAADKSTATQGFTISITNPPLSRTYTVHAVYNPDVSSPYGSTFADVNFTVKQADVAPRFTSWTTPDGQTAADGSNLSGESVDMNKTYTLKFAFADDDTPPGVTDPDTGQPYKFTVTGAASGATGGLTISKFVGTTGNNGVGTGQLVITPTTNKFGTAKITVTLTDPTGQVAAQPFAPQTFTFTLRVNRPPVFNITTNPSPVSYKATTANLGYTLTDPDSDDSGNLSIGTITVAAAPGSPAIPGSMNPQASVIGPNTIQASGFTGYAGTLRFTVPYTDTHTTLTKTFDLVVKDNPPTVKQPSSTVFGFLAPTSVVHTSSFDLTFDNAADIDPGDRANLTFLAVGKSIARAAYDLRTSLGITAAPVKATVTLNGVTYSSTLKFTGAGGAAYYLVLPSASSTSAPFYDATGKQLGLLTTDYYSTANKLLSAASDSFGLTTTNSNIDPGTGTSTLTVKLSNTQFFQTMQVALQVSDLTVTTQYFRLVTFTNNAPVITGLPSSVQTASHNAGPLDYGFAVTDADGDTVNTPTAVAKTLPQMASYLDSTLNLSALGTAKIANVTYVTLQGTLPTKKTYLLAPDGSLYDTSVAPENQIALFTNDYYKTPSLIYSPKPAPSVTLSAAITSYTSPNGNVRVTLGTPTFTGLVQVGVSAGDGQLTGRKFFLINYTNSPATVRVPQDINDPNGPEKTVWSFSGSKSIDFVGTDLDSDTVTVSASVASDALNAYNLDGKYQFSFGNVNSNTLLDANGSGNQQEKRIKSSLDPSVPWYALVLNSSNLTELHVVSTFTSGPNKGKLYIGALVATLDGKYYAHPDLLYNAYYVPANGHPAPPSPPPSSPGYQLAQTQFPLTGGATSFQSTVVVTPPSTGIYYLTIFVTDGAGITNSRILMLIVT